MQSLTNKNSIAGGTPVLVILGILTILIISIVSIHQYLALNVNSLEYVPNIRSLNLMLCVSLLGCFVLIGLLLRKMRTITKEQKDSDHKLISFLDSLKEATFLINKKGFIHYTNKQAESLFGYCNDELKGEPAALLLPGEFFTPGFDQLNCSQRDAKNESFEIIIVNKKGKASQAELKFLPIKLYDGVFSIITITGIKDNPKTDSKFHSLLNAIADATIIVNEKGLIETINQQTINIFGYTRDEIIGKPVEILIPHDAREKHSHDRKEFMKGSDVRAMGAELDLNALRKNGTHFPVEISLSPVKLDENVLVIATVRDISQRMSKDEELRKSEEKFQTLVNSIKDYAIFLIDLDGYICTWNTGAENVLGYHAAEILGKPIDTFYTKKEIENGEPFKDLEKTSITGHHEVEQWRMRKNGSSFFAHNIFKALKDSRGKVYAYTQITHDMKEER